MGETSVAGEAVPSSFGDLQDVVPVTSRSGEVRGDLGLFRVCFAGWQRTALTCARVPAWLEGSESPVKQPKRPTRDSSVQNSPLYRAEINADVQQALHIANDLVAGEGSSGVCSG